jgi:hypothetical protein
LVGDAIFFAVCILGNDGKSAIVVIPVLVSGKVQFLLRFAVFVDDNAIIGLIVHMC